MFMNIFFFVVKIECGSERVNTIFYNELGSARYV